MSDYQVVVVGAGMAGSILAKRLGEAGVSVLVLEAGAATGRTWAEYQGNVAEHDAAYVRGVPNAPWVSTASAPSPSVLDVVRLQAGGPPSDTGYFVQQGPLPFRSDYLRSAGGTSLHWQGICLRMLPSDFELHSRYGVGVDWPLDYEQLEPWYRAAEHALGVSGDVGEQDHHGLWFAPGYVYPMHALPRSYGDAVLADRLDGRPVKVDGVTCELSVVVTPSARNAMPNPAYAGGMGYTPVGAAGAPHHGMRCEGNSSCVPICPVQAKFNALKALRAAEDAGVHVRTQCAVARVVLDPAGAAIAALEFVPYTDGVPPGGREQVTADVYVLAGNAIENARLLLASGACASSDQVGRNLMDHMFQMTWGLMPETIGAFRGPASTSGIETLRDGAFRSRRAAWRVEISNWGWEFSAFSPYADVESAVHQDGLFGAALRERLADEVPRQLRLGFLLEQLPSPRSRVEIRNRYVDALGLPRPVISYDVDRYTRAGMAAATEVSAQAFAYLGAQDRTLYDPGDPGYVTYHDAGFVYFGAGHNIGTHRMGADAGTSVVDIDQRAWDHENLYVVGCGSMPTEGTSNPSLTMTALTLRSAESILDDLGVP